MERFAPHVGTSYRASPVPDGSSAVALVLIQAVQAPNARTDGRPFSLTFESTDGSTLDQGNYWLVREGERPEPVFLVPFAPGQHQATFN